MREIILDTETTGFDPASGHRIVEIGAVEVISRRPTGNVFHQYLNPERDIDAGAIRVHGITNEKVAHMPLFADVADAFLEFMADSPLVAHNAPFDVGFLNAELVRAGRSPLANEVIDTVPMARRKFPGARASLDALCQRFEVDRSERSYHGALLDARLLAEVYMHLMGGLQPTLLTDADASAANSATAQTLTVPLETLQGTFRPARAFPASEAEVAAHQTFLEKFVPNSLWLRPGDAS